jgi:hypothetical protein
MGSRIGLQALRRAVMRDDVSEFPNPGPEHFAAAAFCSLPGDWPDELSDQKGVIG